MCIIITLSVWYSGDSETRGREEEHFYTVTPTLLISSPVASSVPPRSVAIMSSSPASLVQIIIRSFTLTMGSDHLCLDSYWYYYRIQ